MIMDAIITETEYYPRKLNMALALELRTTAFCHHFNNMWTERQPIIFVWNDKKIINELGSQLLSKCVLYRCKLEPPHYNVYKYSEIIEVNLLQVLSWPQLLPNFNLFLGLQLPDATIESLCLTPLLLMRFAVDGSTSPSWTDCVLIELQPQSL